MSTFMSSRKEVLITGKYKVVRRIGGGSFGDIYLAINIANGEVKLYLLMLKVHKIHCKRVEHQWVYECSGGGYDVCSP